MLGADRAEGILRGTSKRLWQSYAELPNSSAFFKEATGQEVVFIKERSGTVPKDHIVSTRNGAWTMKLTKFQLVKEFPALEHSSILCARARQDGYTLTGDMHVKSST